MPPPSSDRFQLVFLGAGSLAVFVGYSGIGSLATPYYQMTLGVSPILLGSALALPRLWEAFADPVVGNLSDNFRSRWGRRRPFILTGAVAMGATFGLMWMVSPAWTETAKLAYFTLMSVLFYSAYTLFSVPYSALTYELSSDYHGRTRLMAHCTFFHKLGELGYQWIFPATQLALFATAVQGVRVVGWCAGALLLTVAGGLPALLVRERFAELPKPVERITFFTSVRATYSCRPFLLLAGMVFCNTVMGMLTSTLDYYVLVYYVVGGDVAAGSLWKALLSSGYAVVGMATIPLVVRLSNRFGKRETLMAMYALTVFGGLTKWITFDPRRPWLALIDPLLCGAIWAAAHVLFTSMLADICDEDEVTTTQRHEGMFAAAYSWIQKTMVSASFLGAGIVLRLSGFQQKLGAAQPAHTFSTMRVLLVAATAVPPLGAIWLLRRYPIDAARAAQTSRRLEERRGLAAQALRTV